MDVQGASRTDFGRAKTIVERLNTFITFRLVAAYRPLRAAVGLPLAELLLERTVDALQVLNVGSDFLEQNRLWRFSLTSLGPAGLAGLCVGRQQAQQVVVGILYDVSSLLLAIYMVIFLLFLGQQPSALLDVLGAGLLALGVVVVGLVGWLLVVRRRGGAGHLCGYSELRSGRRRGRGGLHDAVQQPLDGRGLLCGQQVVAEAQVQLVGLDSLVRLEADLRVELLQLLVQLALVLVEVVLVVVVVVLLLAGRLERREQLVCGVKVQA